MRKRTKIVLFVIFVILVIIILCVLLGLIIGGLPKEIQEIPKTEEVQKTQENAANKADFYGVWYIDKAVLCSEAYTGTLKDGSFEENLYDPADYIGLEVEYHPDYFRLGDEKYINPEYILTNRTVKDVNEGGSFHNPDLYEFIINEKIEITGEEDYEYLAEMPLLQVEVRLDNELSYGDYNFIPVGTQILVLNENSIPKIIDIIIEDDCCTALCEDGSVWAWENIYSRSNLHKISNLNNIIKIIDAGPAMYALSEDGHVYAWGSNEWGQISVEDRDAYFEEAIQLSGLSDVVDMDVNLDADSEKAKGFCIDENGNFYEWGLYLYFEEAKDREPGFPQENIELVQGTKKLFTGTGNYNYFIREDGSVFSIMETDLWESTRDFIFPRLPVEENRFDADAAPLTGNEIPFRTLNHGTKYGLTILYELGEEEGVEKIASDPYTMYLYKEDGTLWYWNSGAVQYHDNKYAMSNPEIYGEDYQGGFEEIDLKKILGIDDKEEHIPKIVDMCAGSENVLFLTDDGQVFVSEYVTSEIRDVEYYILRNTNPNRSRTGWIYDLPLKTVDFYKLDWESIASINTNGEYCFSAVDEQGAYFYLDISASASSGSPSTEDIR